MPLKGAQQGAAGRIPQLQRPVPAVARQHLSPVWGDRHELTTPECPSKVRSWAPLAASHSFSVLSTLPDSTCCPSGENAPDRTKLECPWKVCSRAPLAASHSLSVLSVLPDSTCRPSGENATEETARESPRKGAQL